MNKVAIIGKPNTGKSTLFNRLIRKRKAIVLDEPGVTRDRIYGEVYHQNEVFKLIDTGGLLLENTKIDDLIKIQVEFAMEEASLILFVVDGKEGLTELDKEIAQILKKSNKKVFLVINKIDSKDYEEHKYDFYELGFSDIFSISSEQNKGIYELLDGIINYLPKETKEEDKAYKIAILGRPNVGKSSIINALLKEERVIVSPIPGTTRDAVDLKFNYQNKDYILVDTAGLRKKGKVEEKIEKLSYLRSMEAINDSDISLLVLDAERGIVEHDKHIAGYIKDALKGMVIVVNKWDLTKKTEKEFRDDILFNFKFLPFVKVVFTSAVKEEGIENIMEEVKIVLENRERVIKTSLLNDAIREIYDYKLPPTYKGKRLKIYFISQEGIKPPVFNLRVNDKNLVHFSYYRYLENSLRKYFNFSGTTIVIKFTNKEEKNI